MKLKLSITLFIFITLFAITPIAQASELGSVVNEEFNYVQEGVTGSSMGTDPTNIVIDIIQTVLGFLGLLFVVLIIIAGFQWMTAGGNADTTTKARQRITNAVIGLVIVLAAYSITWFVITNIQRVTKRSPEILCDTTPDCPSGFHCADVGSRRKCVAGTE